MMDVLALILAVIALLVFLYDSRRTGTPRVALLPLGLALLTAAWICQATSITDNMVNF